MCDDSGSSDSSSGSSSSDYGSSSSDYGSSSSSNYSSYDSSPSSNYSSPTPSYEAPTPTPTPSYEAPEPEPSLRIEVSTQEVLEDVLDELLDGEDYDDFYTRTGKRYKGSRPNKRKQNSVASPRTTTTTPDRSHAKKAPDFAIPYGSAIPTGGAKVSTFDDTAELDVSKPSHTGLYIAAAAAVIIGAAIFVL